MEQDINAILKSSWSEWEVVSLLGTGTYGSVYQIKREYPIPAVAALKVMEVSCYTENKNADNISDKANTAFGFFANEAKLLMKLQNTPHIVGIQDSTIVPFPSGGGCFLLIRMELLQPLSSLYPISEEGCINLGIDICMALNTCHENGILHRDIKPGNIMYSESGGYKLTDFGIAKMMDYADNAMTSGRGTLEFMAPEVFSLKNYDFRSDLYGLGLVLYYLVNGCRLPFLPADRQIIGPNDFDHAFQQRMRGVTLPRPANCSEEFYSILQCACAYKPQNRFNSAADMQKALLELRSEKKKYVRKNVCSVRAAISGALISGICFFGLAFLLTHFGLPSLPQKQKDVPVITETSRSLRLLSAPTRLEYICGETLDTAGLLLSVTDSDGLETITSTGFTCEPEILDTLGSVEITVRYHDDTVSYFVNVATPLSFSKEEGKNGWTVTGCSETELPFVHVPAYYLGEPVTRIGDFAFSELDARTVYLPETVTEIGECAFCQSTIEEIVLPQSLETIGPFAFELCTDLVSVDLPEGLSTIGNAAFQGCYSIRNITVPQSVNYIGEAAFYHITDLESLTFLGDAPAYSVTNARPFINVSLPAVIYYHPERKGWREQNKDTVAKYMKSPKFNFLPIEEKEEPEVVK